MAPYAPPHSLFFEMLLKERCQRENVLGRYSLTERLRRRLFGGPIPVKRTIADLVRRQKRAPVATGKPSAFPVGSIVRVKDAAAIGPLLDQRGRTRGLEWMASQWSSCGRTFRVQGHLRRMIDDAGVWRSVSRTVILEDVTCGVLSECDACGRECPIFFRDEWLEAADGVPERDERPYPFRVTVRTAEEIRRTLDAGGGTHGLKLMPEMLRYAGRSFGARKVERSGELSQIVPVEGDFYVLEHLQCDGTILRDGPCERRCSLIWHGAWLRVEA